MTTVDDTPAARKRGRSLAYLPLVLLALAQGIYISAGPSVSVRPSELGRAHAGGPNASGAFDTFGSDASAEFTSGEASTPTEVAGQAGAVGASGGASRPGGSTATSIVAGVAGADMSHCTPEGRQHGKYPFQQEAPGCVARWPEDADNGGATYPGVEGDKVKIVIFEEQPNEQIDAILSAQQLAMTEEDRVRIHKYGMAFANKYYESYGREVEFVRFKSACPVSPPSLVQCKAEARKVIAMKPFAVIFGMSVYPELFDEWARAGIISLGGWNFADSYFTDRRPFRYDVFMTGTRAGRHLIEYYCKKMANKPASNAGSLIHPTIGSRATPRKLGIVVNETEAMAESARYIAQEISRCEGGRYTPEVVTFVGDIDRAAETQEAVTTKMINSKTTTVVCWCGPLEMTGFSKSFTAQQYYPEHLLPGIGLSDADVFARLYDTAQWVHAFGPSHIADSRAKAEYQSYAVYEDAGDLENATIGALLYWLYMDLAVQGIQFAGPNLNPLTFESGLLSSIGTGGGDPKSILWDWGPGDYGGYADVREVWYDPALDSDFDGAKGGYHVMNEHRRFNLGEWSSEFDIPPAPN